MTNAPIDTPAEGAGERKALSAPMVAALWAISNGRCYAPDCPFPVVYEVRPGHFRKNAQIAHIFGVKSGARRYRKDMPAAIRDSFANLLLLCTAHHNEVDSEEGERLYTPEVLREWKIRHEGAQNRVLNNLKVYNGDALLDLLTEMTEPPLKRLEAIADRLEKTGEIGAGTVAELKAIVGVLSDTGPDHRDVRLLAEAAAVLTTHSFSSTVQSLAHAAETLPRAVSRMEQATRQMGQFM
ncbi:hypothetical protein [Actinoplanes teichomyceticus]|uniref:HNH endonuclease n=1 Tax=Actinoplanes teichomyceticus TaxID=1867 RepID=A0A561WBZ6_ACTTI|nr:hypothetical protein [Actinoplanes teichomyceticus]TWG21384.1 hypothetical protein FHX34_103922 [Actinoplanes teichomyceticus]GIF17185.1 hypothetical protein Ate01nite_72170 [Actinoplanes teichomyceticus]